MLPVLIGLAVDYAIQFQACHDEAEARGDPDPALAAAAAGGPTILNGKGTPPWASSQFLLSPVFMVRSFGALLVLGIGLAVLCAPAPASRRWLASAACPPGRRGHADAAALAALGRHPRVARVREWLADRSWRALGLAIRGRAGCWPGLAVAVVGLALDTQSEVVSDVRLFVPQDLQALKDVEGTQEETGVSGEIDVTVRADDITEPAVVSWMTRSGSVLRAHGYRAASAVPRSATRPSCARRSRFRPVPEPTGAAAGARQLLDVVPPASRRALSRPTARPPTWPSAIRLMPLDRQKEVVDDIKAPAPA